jgi:YggT family protein
MRQMRMFAIVAPFAAMDASAGSFATNIWLPFWQALFGFTNFYLFILFMRVLLSWFPALDWSRNPWLIVKVITDPYLNVFRNLIPALFMAIDLTPLLGFMLLQDFVAILENCVVENLFSDTIDEPTSDAFAYMPPDFTRFVTKPV